MKNLRTDFQKERILEKSPGLFWKIIINLTPENQTFLAILHFLIHLFRNENKVLGTY